MPRYGCTYEILDANTKEVLRKRSSDACYYACNSYGNRQSNKDTAKDIEIVTYEKKVNIPLSVEDIEKYINYINDSGVFEKIEFVRDFNEEEHKFIIRINKDVSNPRLIGTYTVLRYLWGDNCGFEAVPSYFIKLADKYPKQDLWKLLQVAHLSLKGQNPGHCLLRSTYKMIDKSKLDFASGYTANDVYGGKYGDATINTSDKTCKEVLETLSIRKINAYIKSEEEEC